ncbi:DNA alkylation repair protein [Aporhodopirellula aestuarii]|uniref:DNA alkylation repair protein n=1 Tax=Aporhodopirellula aestuarii TaxID=2950107 RepID=A0ABT0TX62_9BACT|nr:DNA alkylation repair protein [Aporhodopirellula aestuarii]MCM2369130.1 DNA alkylation repair protein [Aporhodopirellula aestuarii]
MPQDTSGSGFSLKDQLFNRDRVEYLAALFHAADNDFDGTSFVRDTMRRLTDLELKERIVHIAANLENYLAADYRVAAKQIVTALPPPLDPAKTDNDFGDFIFAPLGEFVVRNGLDKKHLKLSLRTLKAITQRFSMEDAIRYFINAYPAETMNELAKWSTDSHYHVRRLASEGTRPLLPWSKRLELDPTAAIPILDTLHADPTRLVTRSVANHLNDIAKSHPKDVLTTLKRWQAQKLQSPNELAWMTKHALRTLIKQGHPQALKLLGFRSKPSIEVSQFSITQRRIKPGEAIEFSFSVRALRDEALLIDYVIDFVKANGKRSTKVHKLKQIELAKDNAVTLHKKHVLRANATTYTLYPGTHHVTLQINGQAFDSASFELL